MLNREHTQRETRRAISSQARETLLEIIAVALYQSDSMEVGFDEVAAAIHARRDQLGTLHAELKDKPINQIAADIRFRFSHKSFMEYLVARFLVTQVRRGTFDPLGHKALPIDIIYFVGSFIVNDRELFAIFSRALRQEDESQSSREWRNNLARAIVSSSVTQEDFSMSAVNIADVATSAIHWKSADLNHVTFDVSGVDLMHFDTSTLRGVSLKGTTREIRFTGRSEMDCDIERPIKTVAIDNSFGRLRIIGGRVDNILIDNSNIEFHSAGPIGSFACKNSTVSVKSGLTCDHLSIEGCFDSSLGLITFRSLEVSRSDVMFDQAPRALDQKDNSNFYNNDFSPKLWVKDSKITMSAFVNTAPLKQDIMKSDFELSNCKIAGLRIERSAAKAMYWLTCEGVLFFEVDQRARFRPNEAWWIDGRLVFVNRGEFLSKPEVADAVINRLERHFGGWLKPWLGSTNDELQARRSQRPDN